MKKSEFISKSFLNALGTLVYVFAISLFMSNGSKIFGGKDSFLTPVFVLLLFVVSASITGYLVLGKPVLLYLDGLKKEAIKFLFYTLGWLVFFLIIVGIIMFVFKAPLSGI